MGHEHPSAGPPSYVTASAADPALVEPPAAGRGVFSVQTRNRTTERKRNATGSRDTEADAVREVQALPAASSRAARPPVAQPATREGADLVLGRSARRQPGADRSDGSRAQAAPVPDAREHGFQGDRGRVSVGQP